MNKIFLTNNDVLILAQKAAAKIVKSRGPNNPFSIAMYAVPRGGIPALYAIISALPHPYRVEVVDNILNAEVVVDDIVDSGETRKRIETYIGGPLANFVALIDKTADDCPYAKGDWIVFPWEHRGDEDDSMTDNVTRILQFIGEDPTREGLLETPARVQKAWEHWAGGYSVDIPALLKTFKDGSPQEADEMVIVKDIPFYSKCEHHLADIFGTATIAYIPNGRIVGLSKLSRLVNAFARRLQVQERLTNQIADALSDGLSPLGVGVIIKARHMCMESRGVCQQGHHTITSALRGVIKTKPAARSEFIQLAR